MEEQTALKKPKKQSLADRIIKASVVVGIAHICLKFAGLIQVKCATQFLNSAEYSAIMVIAMGGIINSLFLIGEEVIGPTFLTIFVKEKNEKDEKAAWDFTNTTISFQSLILIVLCASIMAFPDFYINLFTQLKQPVPPPPGTPETDAAFITYQKLLAEYESLYKPLRLGLPIIAPALFFLSIGSTTYVLLNGYKKFFLAAFGDASTKICIIIGIVVGWATGMGLNALFLGILVGSVAKVATHLLGILGKLKYARPNFNWRNPAFQNMLLLMLPLLAGIIFAKVRDNFNNIYILTGNNIPNQKEVLQANDLGRKLFTTIQWLVPYTLQIALFPFLCELANDKDKRKLGEVLGNCCKLLLSVFVPASVALAFVGLPLTVLIFLGGETNVQVASMAGLSTVCYCMVLPAAAVECVLMQGSFAEQKTVAVTVIGILSSLLSVILSYVFIVHIGVSSVGALMTVALGFAISRILKSTALIWHMRRSIPMFPLKDTSIFLAKLVVLAAIVGVATWGASTLTSKVLPDGLDKAMRATVQQARSEAKAEIKQDDEQRTIATEETQVSKPKKKKIFSDISRTRIVIRLCVSCLTALIAYILGAMALKLQEPKLMIQWTSGKFLGKLKKKEPKN